MNKMFKHLSSKDTRSRSGFTVLFIFLVLLIIVFAQVFAQGEDIQRVAGLQRRAIEQNGEIRPIIDPRLGEMMQEINRR